MTVALIASGAGACGSEDPDAPSKPSRTPVKSSTKPDSPKSQKPTTQAPPPTPQDTDDRPLPEECKHPAGGSVRQSCIEEYGPDGVGTVAPVPPERDRDNDGIDDSVEEPEPPEDVEPEEPTEEPEPTRSDQEVPSKEEQIEECTEQTGMPKECREKIDPDHS
ncbi:hypothetical protein HUT06_34995 [Actinomadura sp. NAK00032]|uniref:hypothetical protein n=1 Tax=Actinomadura sp. NAK00032 TaxID=2742128 RepID=UPI001590F7DE|nr:hypothetical protein [Actinomadura sp. NAK00032]QKW38585.1 hypothetical protein HUT06_34995 [Actinomadura sp. NAK00032]